MRLNKEEKIARISEILKERRANPSTPLNQLLIKWSISPHDFETYRTDRKVRINYNNIGSSGDFQQGPPQIQENSDNLVGTFVNDDGQMVCPATKIPLPIIAKIRGVLKDKKQNPTEDISALLYKWDVQPFYFEKYTSQKLQENDKVINSFKSTHPNLVTGNLPINGFKVAVQNSTNMADRLATNCKDALKQAQIDSQIKAASSNSYMSKLYENSQQSTSAEIGNPDYTNDLLKMHDWITNQNAASHAASFAAQNAAKMQVERNIESLNAIKANAEKAIIEKVTADRNNKLKKSKENICVNCGTSTATLWRRIKSPKEIEYKRPYRKASIENLEYTGKLACNSCALYWSLHGVSFYNLRVIILNFRDHFCVNL